MRKKFKIPGSRAEVSDLEMKLLQCQNRISNILESFTDAFCELDKNWVVTYWNKGAESLMEMPRANVIGRNVWEVYHDAVPTKFYTEYHRAVDNNIAVRFEEFFPRNQLWIEVAAFPTDEGLSIYFKNITASKMATAVLEQERQKYNDLFNLSPVPQWVYDVDTLKFLDVNEAAIDHYGYSRKEFLSMSLKDIRPIEDIPLLNEIISTNVFPRFFNKSSIRHKKKNGELIFVYIEANSVAFEDINARLVMVIDRTLEIMAKRKMEESIKRFDIVSKATSDAIWDLDILTGRMIWNHGLKELFGYKRTSYTLKWWRRHVHPEDLPIMQKKFKSRTKKHKMKLKLEYRFRSADGSYRYVLDRSFIIFNAEGMPIRMIGSIQDITERVNDMKAIEDQNSRLQEISWMQSHKVRHSLAKILGLVSLIEASKENISCINELIPPLKISGDELDQVLKDIVKKSE